MDVLGIEGQVGSLGRVGQPVERSGLEADRAGDSLEVAALAALHVDPQQLTGPQPLEAIAGASWTSRSLPVGVVQPGVRAGSRGADRGDQRTDREQGGDDDGQEGQVTYCRTAIERSRRGRCVRSGA